MKNKWQNNENILSKAQKNLSDRDKKLSVWYVVVW